MERRAVACRKKVVEEGIVHLRRSQGAWEVGEAWGR